MSKLHEAIEIMNRAKKMNLPNKSDCPNELKNGLLANRCICIIIAEIGYQGYVGTG